MLRTFAACLLSVTALAAQMQRPPQQNLPFDVDSGTLQNTTVDSKVLFTKMVRVPTAQWLRVWFDGTTLPTGSSLRITGQKNGWVQTLDADSLPRYFHKSCFFGGEAVQVELVAGPNTTDNRVRINGVTAGAPAQETICGTLDNRALSYDNRQGRLSVGCTGWLISPDVMLTAGHCFSTSSQILSFKVPLSTATGAIVASHPNDQYPTIASTVKKLNDGIGKDWGICRIGRNSNTDLRPGDAYGSWYTLGTVPSTISGQYIRVTGYGTVSSPVSRTWNKVQKTHTGPMRGITSTSLRYHTDTTGGNSGSPLYHTNTGRVIGIHTHGGCTSSSSTYNNGTRIDRSDLQAEIARLMLPSYQRSYFVPDSKATTGSCNVIPFGDSSTSWVNQKYQCLIYKTDIGNYSSLTIRNLAFLPCSTGVHHFGTISIRMAQTAQTTLSTTFANNMDSNVRTVLSKRNYDWHNTKDQWNRIGLDTNYPYTGGTYKNIVIEVTVTGNGGTAGGYRTTNLRERVYAYNWTRVPASGTRGTSAALKVALDYTAADLQLFGIGCLGSNRKVPALGLGGTGALNSTLTVTLSNALPYTNSFLVMNVSRFYQPVDLWFAGAPKCNLYMYDLILAGIRCNSSGGFKLSGLIPRTTPVGQRLFLQFFPLDRGANSLGVTSSNYGMVVVGF